jgi:hypothetical protein
MPPALSDGCLENQNHLPRKGGYTMVYKIRSLGLSGVSGYEVTVECFLSGGLPGFDIVGLPDAAVTLRGILGM